MEKNKNSRTNKARHREYECNTVVACVNCLLFVSLAVAGCLTEVRGRGREQGSVDLGLTDGKECSKECTPCVTFRLVVVSLRGSVGCCGQCPCWCRFHVHGAQGLVCWGCAGCDGMCRLRVSGAQLAYCGCAGCCGGSGCLTEVRRRGQEQGGGV